MARQKLDVGVMQRNALQSLARPYVSWTDEGGIRSAGLDLTNNEIAAAGSISPPFFGTKKLTWKTRWFVCSNVMLKNGDRCRNPAPQTQRHPRRDQRENSPTQLPVASCHAPLTGARAAGASILTLLVPKPGAPVPGASFSPARLASWRMISMLLKSGVITP